MCHSHKITRLIMKLRLPTTPFPQFSLLAFRMEEAMTVGSILDFREKLESGEWRENPWCYLWYSPIPNIEGNSFFSEAGDKFV